MAQRKSKPPRKALPKSNKFLTFDLGEETFGIDILKIREIIGITNITAVPQAPDSVRGVINLRGRIIPVADLRRRLSLSPVPDTERSCIIVAELGGDKKGSVQVGLVVDAVSEVTQITEIAPPPELGEGARNGYIQGMAKSKEKVVILLDIDRVLANGMGTAFRAT